jgi:hypothetical protein
VIIHIISKIKKIQKDEDNGDEPIRISEIFSNKDQMNDLLDYFVLEEEYLELIKKVFKSKKS